MALNSFTGAQTWTQQPHPYQTPAKMHQNHQLNPLVPGFQPNGTEIQRYQELPPTPSSSNQPTPTEMLQMKRFILDSHFSHTKDFTGLERRAWKNSEEIETVKEVVGHDVRSLQSRIEELEQKIAIQPNGHISWTRQSMADHVTAPPEDIVNNFSKESIAQAYLEEAEECEQAAAKLREQAKDICSDVSIRRPTPMRFLDAPNGTGGDEAKAEFACCGRVFESAPEMLEHIRKTHDLHAGQQGISVAVNGESTPTHVPPRRAKVEKPNVTAWAEAVGSAAVLGPNQETAKAEAFVENVADATDELGDTAVKTVSDKAVTSPVNEEWVPLAVQQMPPPVSLDIADKEMFTWELIKLTYGGKQWSPGFYFVGEHPDITSKAYWVLDADWEPYLPSSPGQHGAKLTAFFNNTESVAGEAPDETNYINTPAFIRPEGATEYVYFGQYSQKRFSDKLDYDRVMAVPEKVRRYWAEQLASADRPVWVTNSLMEHFWPRPIYSGPIPTDAEDSDDEKAAKLERRVTRALSDYAEELKVWEKESTIKVSCLPADTIMAAFGNADADEVPGLRLWWEYMEFEKYDVAFYNRLVKVKRDSKPQEIPTANLATPKPKPPVGGKTVKRANGVETAKPQPAPATSGATAGTKCHTVGVKPWETPKADPKDDPLKPDDSKAPNGDIAVAKQLQKDFKKSSTSKQKGHSDGPKAYVAPHVRGK